MEISFGGRGRPLLWHFDGICHGVQSQDGCPSLACFLRCIRCTLSATPGDILVASMEAEPFHALTFANNGSIGVSCHRVQQLGALTDQCTTLLWRPPTIYQRVTAQGKLSVPILCVRLRECH